MGIYLIAEAGVNHNGDVARALAMSPSSFARHFRAGAGGTPARALAAIRMRRAAELLARGDRVLDVALELGFGSGSAFARAWRRHHGRAPRARATTSEGRRSA